MKKNATWMLKRLGSGLASVCALGLCLSAVAQENRQPPTADEVLDGFYEALGGEMAITGIDQVRITGESAEPMTGEMELLYKEGKMLMRFTSYGPSGESITGFDGKAWWRRPPGTETAQEISDEDLALVQHFALFTPQFLAWRDFAGSIEVTDTSEFHGHRVWHLKFTNPDGQVIDRYYDRDTGLLLGNRIEIERIEHVTLYEFKDINGVKWVSTATLKQTVDSVESEYDVKLTFTDFDFDVDLDDEQFAGPSDK